MKLIRANQDEFQFELSRSEKLRLVHILKLYPLVPASHHHLSKGRKIPNREENQQLLEEALKHQREVNRKHLESMLNESQRFVKYEDVYRASFTRAEIEWLLQALNDVRVGSWIALGSPEQREEAIKRLSEQNAPHVIAMDVAGYFEGYFLDAISGELKPGENRRQRSLSRPSSLSGSKSSRSTITGYFHSTTKLSWGGKLRSTISTVKQFGSLWSVNRTMESASRPNTPLPLNRSTGFF